MTTLTTTQVTNSINFATSLTNFNAVTITPEIAQFLLDNHNAKNRPVDNAKAKKYAKIMATGEWAYTEESKISIATDGNLNDGQHTLVAITLSESTIVTDLKVGCNPANRKTLDLTKTRTLDDQIVIVLKERNAITGYNLPTTKTFAVHAKLISKYINRNVQHGMVTDVTGGANLCLTEIEAFLEVEANAELLEETAVVMADIIKRSNKLLRKGVADNLLANLVVQYSQKQLGTEYLQAVFNCSAMSISLLQGSAMQFVQDSLTQLNALKQQKVLPAKSFETSVQSLLATGYNRMIGEGKPAKVKGWNVNNTLQDAVHTLDRVVIVK